MMFILKSGGEIMHEWSILASILLSLYVILCGIYSRVCRLSINISSEKHCLTIQPISLFYMKHETISSIS